MLNFYFSCLACPRVYTSLTCGSTTLQYCMWVPRTYAKVLDSGIAWYRSFCHIWSKVGDLWWTLPWILSYCFWISNIICNVQMTMTFSDHVKSRIRDCRFNVVNGQQLLVPVFCMGFYKVKSWGFHFGAQNSSNVLKVQKSLFWKGRWCDYPSKRC